jgi:phenylacetate-CoA ligase
MPVLRYRTGDLVSPDYAAGDDCRFVTLTGGILGRADDMVIIRGVNIFPSSIESIIREFPEVREFRVTAVKVGIMDDLLVEVEDPDDNPSRISDLLQHRLGLRINVQAVPLESLPRFEAKSKRFVDKR